MFSNKFNIRKTYNLTYIVIINFFTAWPIHLLSATRKNIPHIIIEHIMSQDDLKPYTSPTTYVI